MTDIIAIHTEQQPKGTISFRELLIKSMSAQLEPLSDDDYIFSAEPENKETAEKIKEKTPKE